MTSDRAFLVPRWRRVFLIMTELSALINYWGLNEIIFCNKYPLHLRCIRSPSDLFYVSIFFWMLTTSWGSTLGTSGRQHYNSHQPLWIPGHAIWSLLAFFFLKFILVFKNLKSSMLKKRNTITTHKNVNMYFKVKCFNKYFSSLKVLYDLLMTFYWSLLLHFRVKHNTQKLYVLNSNNMYQSSRFCCLIDVSCCNWRKRAASCVKEWNFPVLFQKVVFYCSGDRAGMQLVCN